MCGPASKTIGRKEINYKGYVITIKKELAYPKRLKNIFYEFSASTKESKKYHKELSEWYEHNYGDESKKPKDPDYKTGKYISSYISIVDVVDIYKRRGIKTQKQVDDVIKLFKKKIDETK